MFKHGALNRCDINYKAFDFIMNIIKHTTLTTWPNKRLGAVVD